MAGGICGGGEGSAEGALGEEIRGEGVSVLCGWEGILSVSAGGVDWDSPVE